MPYRLVGSADRDLVRVLTASAKRWGPAAAGRYQWLIQSTIDILAETAEPVASRSVAGVPGVRIYALRHGLRRAGPGGAVDHPRHLILYRVAEDGVVEILGLIHDRMLLTQAARRRESRARRRP